MDSEGRVYEHTEASHEYEFNRHCGAKVCAICDDHQGLERCFCGWSRTSPGRGREELIGMGETIEEE